MALTNRECILLNSLKWAKEQEKQYSSVRPNITLDLDVTLDGYYNYYTDIMGLTVIHLFTYVGIPEQSIPYYTFIRLTGGVCAIEIPFIYGNVPINNASVTQKQPDFDVGLKTLIPIFKEKKTPLLIKCGNDIFHDAYIEDLKNDYLVINHIHAEANNSCCCGYIKKGLPLNQCLMVGIPMNRLKAIDLPSQFLNKEVKEYFNRYIECFRGEKFTV